MSNEGKVKIGVNADTGEDIFRDMTAKELSEMDTPEQLLERKLDIIKELRLVKLQETDYLSNSDMTMSDDIKTWRQSLRDIPQNYTTEEEYDLLKATDEDGNLTHSIWNKP